YGARSLANVTLDPQFINDGGTGFSWLFRTKDDSAACAIDSVKIEPATSTVNVIGATANYYSTPLGKPDACSAQGQILSKDVNGFPFDWAWDSQYHPVAVVSQVDKGERLLGSTTLSEYCGDNVVTPSKEDCDSLTASCSPNCRLTTVGTQACTATNKVQCCGNGGAPEYGEECDFGPLNGVPGSTCTFNCLNKKIPISLNYCLAKNTSILNLTARKADCLGRWGAVAVCGNGGTVEDGEECDLGSARNGNVGENCSNTCLLKAKVFGSATGQCGDKIVNSANNEQCDGQLECGADCQWTFKGDGKIDPDQYAKAVGLGTVDAHNQQKTPVTASTNGKTGTADFILQCGYSPVDDSCPGTDLDKGIGTNSCCYPRPQVVTATPVSGVGTWPRPGYISGICPNAKLSIRFNQVMSETSFTSSTLGFYNIILAEATTTPNCPSGTYWVGYQEKQPQNFWQKVKFVVSHWLGMPVAADTYCAGGLNYDLETRTNAHIINGDSVSSTVVSLILKEPLDSLKNYRLLATKDVTNYFKVKMQNPWMIDFTTASQLCKINQLSIDPDVYGFKRKDEEKVFAAKPEFLNESVNAPAQELLDMPGIYGWNYNWLDGDLAVNLINVNPVAGTNQATAAAVGNNGDTTLGAKVTITEDTSASSTVGKVFSASSTISVFICENPWPSSTIAPGLGLGYFDAAGNLNGIPVGLNWSNFKLLYCRDAGDVNVTADDISALSPVVLTHTGDTSGIFKEFFFTFNSVTNKNSIGLRVYPNTDHLSIADWYKTQPWIPKGAPTPAKVGSGDHVYESLQEGKTYYINGLNTSGSSVFTNVYVLAFSDNPYSETLNVIPQLLNEFTLNVNELDNKTKVSALTRDFTRFKDLKVVSEKLAASYNSKGFFPKLTENPQYSTFLPAYTNSKWQSWQLLSNSLGFGMPTDPINQFVNCGSSTLTVGVAPNVVNLNLFDSDTCWNAASSTFACLAGSHVFQYETSGGNSSIVKNDFEEPTMNWVNGLTNILNVKLCSLTKRACASDSECYQPKCVDSKCELTGTTCASDAVCATNPNTCTVAGVNFQLSGSCTGVVQGIGGRCGDGIVGVDEHGVTEQCEIGQTKYNSCTPSDDTGTPFINESLYPGKQLMQCNNTCTGFVSGGSSCVAQGFCGDGVKQGGEQCDKGDNNGKYGYSCDTHCRDLTNKCGDGIFQVSSEVCDLSTTQGVGFPAAWNLQESQSCSWDCQSRDYCGDGKVNFEHEECEKSEFCQVGKCLSSVFKQKINDSFIGGVLVSNNSNKYCEVNNNCSVVYEEPTNKIQVKTVCKKPENVCALSWFENGVESFLNHVVPDLIGGETIPCQTDNDCSGTCATPGSGKRYCAAPGENKYKKFVGPVFQDATTTASIAPSGVLTYTNTNKTCSWERTDLDVNYFSSTDVTCLPLSSVPTPISQLNCGVDADKDGSFKDPGEECDFGCNLQTVSGPYCGDGNIQRSAGEVCDMTGCPYGSCTNSSTSQDNDTCSSDCKSFICPAGWTFHESSPGVCL
ncbi:MAG: hypothetical protein NTU97_02170, partial [Candidatus Magasanikbacteria bacterium]|nr:hypothetical protein [Candidatus Magasanikbacteria bacterium]